MKLAITRTKRPRDAYKASDGGALPAPAKEVNLVALRITPDGDRWRVTFRMVPGFKRSAEQKISPFWDCDLASALLRWNRDNGGEGGITAGCDFITDRQEDALMMRMAFS